MKDMSLFLLKNSLGAKMKKGIRTFCNGDGSTSTLNQQNNNDNYFRKSEASNSIGNMGYSNCKSAESQPTLEEMILEMELKEEMARKATVIVNNIDDHQGDFDRLMMRPGRMSCVNNSDILRSARNALNQYPRFSLDGKDAMYRSSFQNIGTGTGRLMFDANLPPTLGGENVVWCKPGVVAKLMGLEAVPVPVSSKGSSFCCNKNKKTGQNLHRRVLLEERHDCETGRTLAMDVKGTGGISCKGVARRKVNNGIRRSVNCSKDGFCIMKSVGVDGLPVKVPVPVPDSTVDWQPPWRYV